MLVLERSWVSVELLLTEVVLPLKDELELL